jgi:hypothetical protein
MCKITFLSPKGYPPYMHLPSSLTPPYPHPFQARLRENLDHNGLEYPGGDLSLWLLCQANVASTKPMPTTSNENPSNPTWPIRTISERASELGKGLTPTTCLSCHGYTTRVTSVGTLPAGIHTPPVVSSHFGNARLHLCLVRAHCGSVVGAPPSLCPL